MNTILVAGSARGLNDEAKRATRLIGVGLAQHGFGLITGSWPGVDRETSDSFLRTLEIDGIDPISHYRQINYKRWQPFSHAKIRDHTLRVDVANGKAAYNEIIKSSAAGIFIGGVGGVRDVAFELIGSGRPAFPLPLTGGDALRVYTDILESWSENPVPGVTQRQFMTLSLPLRRDAERIMQILQAALAPQCDIFLSYRRDDVPGAAGRLAAELIEHFGPNRVFLDTHSIKPGADFGDRIQQALDQSKVMVCVMGPRWAIQRTHDAGDYVRREIANALESRSAVVPVRAFGGSLPARSDLPPILHGLLDRQVVSIDNETWDIGVSGIVAEIKRILREPNV